MSEVKTEMLKPGEDPNDFNSGPTVEVRTENFEEPIATPEALKKITTSFIKKEEVATAKVELNARGLPLPKNIDEAFRIAEAMFKGGAFPKWVKSAVQALAVSQFCRSLGLDPMVGIQHVCEINGRLSLWGEGPLAAVRASGKLEFIQEIFVDKDYKTICLENKNLDAEIFAAVCRVQRIDSDLVVERFFTAEDEKTAMKGLPAVWKGYRRIMYKRKARAEALKDEFGDILGGAGIAEYDYHTAPDIEETPTPTAFERIQNAYGDRSKVSQGSESNAVPDMSPAALRSMPREDLQGIAKRPLGEHSADVPGTPQ
jgi:hypothetical protein